MSNLTKKILVGLAFFTMISAGTALIFHQSITNWLLQHYSMKYLDGISRADMKNNESRDASFDAFDVIGFASSDVASMYQSNQFTNMPVIGAMTIPELGMNLPIFKGLSNEALSIGAGTMKDGQKLGTGNFSLASHSLFDGYRFDHLLFTPLKHARAGMKIYARDADAIYEYVIDGVEIVDPDAGYVILDSQGDKLITLVTCTDMEATQRIIVRGHLTNQSSYEDTPSQIKEYFDKNWTRWL